MQALTEKIERVSLHSNPKEVVSQLQRASTIKQIETIWNANRALADSYVICAYLQAHIKLRKNVSTPCYRPVLDHAKKSLSQFRIDSLAIFANTLTHLQNEGKEIFTDMEDFFTDEQLKKLESRHLTLLVDATVVLSKFPRKILQKIANIFCNKPSRFSRLKPTDLTHASRIFSHLDQREQKRFFLLFEKALSQHTLKPWQAAKIIDQIADLDTFSDTLLETLLSFAAENLHDFDAEELGNIKEVILYRKKQTYLLEKIVSHIRPKYDALSWRIRHLAAYSGIAPIPNDSLNIVVTRLKKDENWKELSIHDLALCTICFINRDDVDKKLFQNIREKLFTRESLFQLQKRKIALLQNTLLEHLCKSTTWSTATWETVALLVARSKDKDAAKILLDRIEIEQFKNAFMPLHAFENGGHYEWTLPNSDSFEENLLIIYFMHHEKNPELFSQITVEYLHEIYKKRMDRHPLERNL